MLFEKKKLVKRQTYILIADQAVFRNITMTIFYIQNNESKQIDKEWKTQHKKLSTTNYTK